jgi:hypothetical protein
MAYARDDTANNPELVNNIDDGAISQADEDLPAFLTADEPTALNGAEAH